MYTCIHLPISGGKVDKSEQSPCRTSADTPHLSRATLDVYN